MKTATTARTLYQPRDAEVWQRGHVRIPFPDVEDLPFPQEGGP